jgi:2-keto-4-pentenoate hydratase/2-oxohepta-3-ene-1,7-dioic acid hydratase in catechol pathway
MTRIRIGLFAALTITVALGCTPVATQERTEPYKLGMFRLDTRTFPGVVVGDDLVIDLTRAGIQAPSTVHELVAGWNPAMAGQIATLAAQARQSTPSFAVRLSQLKTLPPISDPDSILMAARNYVEHANEMAQAGRTLGTTTVVDEKVRVGIPGLWTRKPDDARGNPYLFPKLKSSLAADGDFIVLPPGREHIDYECELGVVIGRTAKRVPVDRALDYVFGYVAMTDVSDREDRADGRYGSDWLISKSFDTFGPIGPFLVPAAFVGDPQNLAVKYTLNGNVMQDGNTNLMIHGVAELISYASHIATLEPGDIIGTGTPGGVGEARVPPVYLKPGDKGVCSIEKIGSLTNTVQAAR